MMQSPSPFSVAADAAMRRAVMVGVVASVVVGLVLLVIVSLALNVLLGLLLGVVVMVVGSAAWLSYVRGGFGNVVAAVTDGLGEVVSEADQPGWCNALDGVAILTGVAKPEVRLLDVDAANAMVASDGRDSTVIVTRGLLEVCRTIESEVIAADLLCRVRDESARYATLAAGLPSLLGRAAGIDEASLVQVLGEQRAVHTDADAVAVTKYPPGLVSALERMNSAGTRLEGVSPATAALWIAPAFGPSAGVDASVDRTINQPLDYRIAVLREL